jgi:hypothetical protein
MEREGKLNTLVWLISNVKLAEAIMESGPGSTEEVW